MSKTPSPRSPTEKPKPEKPDTADWERIQREYSVGILSVREIARACGVSHTAIQKRAAAEHWTRDLNGKIKAKADELVAKAAVANTVASRKKLATSESAIVDANAQTQASVRIKHQKRIGQAEQLLAKMLAELEVQTDHPDTYEALLAVVEGVTNPFTTPETEKGRAELTEAQARRMAALEAVLSLPERSKTMKNLVENLQKLVALEREAYGIAAVKLDEQPPAAPVSGDPRDHYQWLASQGRS